MCPFWIARSSRAMTSVKEVQEISLLTGELGVSPNSSKSPKVWGITGGLDDIIIELASRSYTGLDIK